MRDGEVTPVALTEQQHEEILASEILPAWTRAAVPQREPVVVVVAGPPGSGKSTVCTLLKAVLDQRGGAVLIGRDLYKSAHPEYSRLLRSDDRRAGVRVRPDTVRWQAEVEEYVRRHRLDAVLETPLSDPQGARAMARAFRAAGFRIEVVVLAAAEAVTQLSVLDRYLRQVGEEGAGRYVSWDNHDACVHGLPHTLEVVEAEQLADRVMVVRRDFTVLYDNELTGNGPARSPVGAHRVVQAERARPWTAPETWRWSRQLAGLEQRLHPAVSVPDRRLAVAGGLERARALAEPVRRIGQPLTVAPGVDYHRLSADEHRFVFDELIVPMYLNTITPHEQPVVLYVMGPQGAGKSYTARTLRRVLRARRPTRIEGGMFKDLHPDYRRLVEEQPRTASARIRADYRAWQERAEAYVRERRGDLLIEIAPDNAAHLLAGARRHHEAGYRVEVIVLGMRAADSRLGIATRCAELARIGAVPRFTQAAAHARSFAVLADVVRAAEEAANVVDSVSVIRRDLTAVYRNQRTPGGVWARPPQGGQAVVTEQQRPYTPAEAARLLATLQQVQGALPQYRFDLVEIAALAWPLMPAHLRPPALATTIPPGALPMLRQGNGGYSPLSSLERVA
ncbi:zeta toxin family protein [Streptomyces aureoverticillatus]|uniref:zeta toxin family protein n=1 Tax=Streptomyces aureoverticillatus TaxID=66871 RepID=UPI0013DB7452|nr:zeta toxin family protein [Streptomyces aureoverticillatus]QIB49477.1 AAA family ATPase [Streptomyces aureoverticillatus]